MDLERYEYKIKAFKDFEFYSNGPKGRIKKIVRFTERFAGTIRFYNLGFGDWNEEKGRIDDFVTSDNEDSEKILATVAAMVVDFTNNYKDPVYAKGSTPSRTRLYQMGLQKHYREIDRLFDLYGLVNDKGWQRFEHAVNYEAFLVVRK